MRPCEKKGSGSGCQKTQITTFVDLKAAHNWIACEALLKYRKVRPKSPIFIKQMCVLESFEKKNIV